MKSRPLKLLACLLAAAAAAGAAGKPGRERVLRAWDEDVTVAGRKVPGRVELIYNYDTGRARREVVVVTAAGTRRVLSSQVFPPGAGQPRPSEEEIAEAMALVRADAEIAKVIEVTQAVLDGGFQVFQAPGKPCGPGSRCLKVQLMTDNRLGFVRNVVVDLNKQSIVYRNFLQSDEGEVKK